MDPVLLSRVQFAVTVGFHFLFPPLTIGLAWLLVWLVGRFARSGAEEDGRIARFWVNLFAITFAVGVATGITMEFQFGTNWAQYARFVGDIFGAPLAIEVILAFFLESTFLGVLLFGWERVSRRALWVATWMVALGSTLSAFWIIVANSWMQTPAGFALRNGRAELTDPLAAVFNASTWPRFLHTLDGALLTGAFFMLGISAWFLLKGRHGDAARRTLTGALLVAFIGSVGQLALGHYHAVQVAFTQPAKLAACEGLFETQAGAPLLVFGIPDAAGETVHYAVRIPTGLSWLVHLNPTGVVTGLRDFPREEWPPLALTFYPFHLMVGLGMFLIAFTGLGVLLLWLKRAHTERRFLGLACLVIPLPFLANELGWMTAEVGRQPWAVYGVLRTSEAATSAAVVPAGQILASLIMFGIIYVLLFVVWIAALRRQIRLGIQEPSALTAPEVVA